MVFSKLIPCDQNILPTAGIPITDCGSAPAAFENGIRNFQSIGTVRATAFKNNSAAIAFSGRITSEQNAVDRSKIRCRNDYVALVVRGVVNLPAQLGVTQDHLVSRNTDRFVEVTGGSSRFQDIRESHSLTIDRNGLIDGQCRCMQVCPLIDMNDSAGGYSRDRLGDRGKSIEPIDTSLVASRQEIIVRNGGAIRKPNKGVRNIHIRDCGWSTDQHNVIARAAVVIDAVCTTTPGRNDSAVGEPRKGPDDGINAIILNDDVDVSGQRLS